MHNPLNKPIALCGFMGSGKTRIGQCLARLFDVEFIDLDHYLVEKEGQSIPEIFASKGEGYFREREIFYLKEIANSAFKGILSLGGGALHNEDVVKLILQQYALAFIHTHFDVIFERVCRNTTRPLLLDEQGQLKPKDVLWKELQEKYHKRIPLYTMANIIFEPLQEAEIEENTYLLIQAIQEFKREENSN